MVRKSYADVMEKNGVHVMDDIRKQYYAENSDIGSFNKKLEELGIDKKIDLDKYKF